MLWVTSSSFYPLVSSKKKEERFGNDFLDSHLTASVTINDCISFCSFFFFCGRNFALSYIPIPFSVFWDQISLNCPGCTQTWNPLISECCCQVPSIGKAGFKKITVYLHQPHSQDLALCNFWLFLKVKMTTTILTFCLNILNQLSILRQPWHCSCLEGF